jgi:hypothetical protein
VGDDWAPVTAEKVPSKQLVHFKAPVTSPKVPAAQNVQLLACAAL